MFAGAGTAIALGHLALVGLPAPALPGALPELERDHGQQRGRQGRPDMQRDV